MPDLIVQLTEVVSDALDASTFCPTSATDNAQRIGSSLVRQLHADAVAGRIQYPTYYLYCMDVCTETAKLAPLVDLLRSQLAPIIDESGQVALLEEKMTPDDFAAATLRAAAILSPMEAATAIHHWISGGPWIEKVYFTLTGITVSEPVIVRPGASFERLPEEPKDIFGHVPNMMALALQRGSALQDRSLLGATVLSAEEYTRPVLRNAIQTPGHDLESAFPGGWETMWGHFLTALSLACNAPVARQYSWRTSSPVQQAFYVRGAEGWGLPGPGPWPHESAVELTSPLVEQALRLADKLHAFAEPEWVRRVFERWFNSLRREHHLEDQFIEIRIALESLYAAGGMHETSLRVAYHGARHLGRSLEERRVLFRDLKAIYNAASAVIHGRTPKHSKKERDLVERAQGIIREALLKILDDGAIPDWTDLMLKGH